MQKFAFSEYLSADIGITEIVRIYKASTKSWLRPEKEPRDREGLLFFTGGAIRYDLDGTVFEARAGQVLRLPKGIPYSGLKLDDEELNYYCIDFLTARDGEYNALPLPFSFTPTDGAEVLRRFSELEALWSEPKAAYIIKCKRDILELIAYLIRDGASADYGRGGRSIEICDYLKRNMGDPYLSVKSAALHFHMSETHLRRVFRAEMGVSPVEYLIGERLRRAKELLISDRDKQLSEIGEECGYSSLYYFSASFKKTVGISPSEYRLKGISDL